MELIELKRDAKKAFSEHGIEDNDNTILEMLFEHAFGFTRNFMLCEPHFEIDTTSEQYHLFKADIEHLVSGVPIQHITGVADFCKLKFFVSQDVLIPRQETEILVKIALYNLNKSNIPNPRVLDLCSGSGGIGISVKKYCPKSVVTLSDISVKALEISKKNAENILGSFRFIDYLNGDFLAPAIGKKLKFDMILSNPPYIKTSDLPGLPKNVYGHDPTLALDGGENGIVPYEKIIPDLCKVLNDGGIVIFEIGETQGHEISSLLKREGSFEKVEIVKDLSGRDRFVCASYSEKENHPVHLPEEPCSNLPGIGKKGYESLCGMGVFTIKDLLSFYPKKYEDRTVIRTLSEGLSDPLTPVTYKLVIKKINEFGMRGKKVIAVYAFDKTGGIKIVFFNMPYVRGSLFTGQEYYFYGNIEKADTSYPEIINPKFIPVNDSGANDFLKIHPVYRERRSIRRDKIKKAVREALITVPSPADFSSELQNKYNLISRADSLKNIHFPENQMLLSASVRRLSFDNLLRLSIGISLSKAERKYENSRGFAFKNIDATPLNMLLPYKLTRGQEDTISAIFSDMESPSPMNRLVIGDVGSGKTAIALFAVYKALKNGKQAAFMVPSTVLADQHYEKLKPYLEALGFDACLLLSSTKSAEKKAILNKIRAGETLLVIGTHSLIQENVVFKNLGLVVTDEQHRFGVNQRKMIIGSYDTVPDVLLLTATPIPRTLALVLYGDMDISYLKEKPSGRKDTLTTLSTSRSRKSVYEKALNYVSRGEQVFVVHSCIEDAAEELDLDEDIDTKKMPKSCISNHRELSEGVFSDIRTAVLHGKMKDDEKSEIMKRFASGEIDVLFSTTVIEVGIDVKNASLMIIENADRFGLSQLHQLRGRVGRGSNKSECILISENPSENDRLSVMAREHDGFRIAEEDLSLRGPGELLGTVQSGKQLFSLLNPLSDPTLMESVNACASEIISLASKDENSPENKYLHYVIKENGLIVL